MATTLFNKWRFYAAALASVGVAFLTFRHSVGSRDDDDGGVVFSAGKAALAAVATFASTTFLLGGWRFALIVYRTIRRDVKGILVFVKMKLIIRKHVKDGRNIPSLWEETVDQFRDKPCVYFEDQVWSFRELDGFSNRVAHYFLSRQDEETSTTAAAAKRPVVALMMESRPEFVGFWLGLSKIDIPTALLNNKLRLQSIAHSLQEVEARFFIYDVAHRPCVDAAKSLFPPGVVLLCFNPAPVVCGALNPEIPGVELEEDADFKARLFTCSSQPVPCHRRAKSTFGDVLLYIFTSGTTGLPKAALMRQQRFYVTSFAMMKAFNITSDDIVYNCLPLYHAAGNNLGVGLALMQGCSVVLTRKFSARAFWDDCRKYNATVVQYIGEICRYLVAQPFRENDSHHKVRLALGNGLRPQIWTEFQTRFGIEQIGEFYGATEGNANMLNTANRAGAIGFTSPLFRAFHPISFIKMDKDNEKELRDANGLCIHCGPGEEGQLVGRIPNGDRLLQFDGYVNRRASGKKVLENVWRKGDRAFASGDVMLTDELGFVYFRDRIGDTFRWKGENVSTAEVESVIMEALGLEEDVAVYGVAIPGTEGRAGMAAIHLVDDEGGVGGGDADDAGMTKKKNNNNKLLRRRDGTRFNVNQDDDDNDINIGHLAVELKRRLAPFAVPVFLRLRRCPAESTGSFKIKKQALKEAGFDLARVAPEDKIYFLHPRLGDYVRLEPEHLRLIGTGDLRF